MKTLSRNLLPALILVAFIGTSFNAMAQYPAASAVLVNNDLTKYSIRSTEDYLRIERQITALGESLGDALKKYPSLNYMPVYNEDQIVAFIINGVNNSAAADAISNNLMQLEILYDAVRYMDVSLLPSAKDAKMGRVSKKVASK
jgi:hypothetical protein